MKIMFVIRIKILLSLFRLLISQPSINVERISQKIDGPEMVNKFSFMPEPPSSEWFGPMRKALDQISPPQNPSSTPYSVFFIKTKSIKNQTEITPIRNLAENILHLISTLTPTPEPWNMWLQRNEDLVTSCLSIAEDALKPSKNCNRKERLWAVGILSALVKYLSPNIDGITSQRKLDFYNWSLQVYVEIQATIEFEPFMTANFKTIWAKDEELPRDTSELKECLDRAQLFGDLCRMMEQSISGQTSDLHQFVVRYLVNTKLPEKERQLEKFIDDFRKLYKKMNLHLWEDDTVFRDFHGANAKQDIFDALQDLPENHPVKAHHNMIHRILYDLNFNKNHEDILKFLINELQTGVEINRSSEYNLTVYEVLIGLCILHPTAEKYFVQEAIEKGDNVPVFLAHIWMSLYPKLVVTKGTFSQYGWRLLIMNPTYLQDARRQLSAINMQHSNFFIVREMGRFLKTIPRKSGGNTSHALIPDNVIIEQYKRVAQNLYQYEDSDYISELQAMSFEFVFHLVNYKESWASLFLEQLHYFEDFKTNIWRNAYHLRKSGIDEWKQNPDDFHVNSSEIYDFINKILDFPHQLWEETSPAEGHCPTIKFQPEWLTQEFDGFVLWIGNQGYPFHPKPS
ncbi:hypothetical protein DFH28DRAFT_1110491 [Melampsora americana]|nr:hypothetical protein DFH28DRAFT_1110491 [Melampsora americana]